MYISIIKKIKELDKINKNKSFIEFRERNLRNVLIAMAFIGISITMLFHLLDHILFSENIVILFHARLFICGILLILFGISFLFKKRVAFKLLIYIGFYLTSFFCTFLAYYTGGLSSPYWGALIFVLIIWLTFIPFNYKHLTIHGAIFIFQYLFILFQLEPSPINMSGFWESTFFLIGTQFIGKVMAFVNNQSTAKLYMNNIDILNAQDALLKSEFKYKTLISNANDGIIVTQDGVFKFVNRAFCNITGYAEQELIGKQFNDLIVPEDHQRLRDIHIRRMKGENVPSIYSTIGVGKTGKKIHLEFNSNTIDFNGRPASFVIMRDDSERIEAEEAIRESEEKYKALVERANDGIVILQDGIVRFINQMMANILGYSVKEMLDTPFPKYLATEFVDSVLNYYKKRQEGEEVPAIYESVLIDKFSNRKAVEFNSSIITFKGQIATQVFIRDIADRKLAEQALKESEIKYREMTDFLPQMIYETDMQGNVTYLNKTGLDMLGYLKEDIIKGVKIFQFTVPEQREDLENNFESVILNGLSGKANEYFALRKNGSKFPVMVYGSPIYKNGVITGNRGTVVDISLRKQTEERLREVNQRLTLHINQTPLAYIEWNASMEVVEWNPAAVKIFGFSREEALGRHAYEIIVPEEVKPYVDTVIESILNEKGGSFAVNENVTKGGKRIFCEWYNTPLNNCDNKVIGLASLVQDISERKRLEAELEKTLTSLEKKHSATVEKMQNYFTELQVKKNELLRLQKENLQSQFETLKNQVNPHFLFNSLNVLASLISVEPELAEEFTGKLSKIYRYVLEHKSDDLVSLNTESDFLKAYVFLLNIRFSEKLKVNMEFQEEKMELKLPPLALQLLIENAIKHNVFSAKTPLVIDIFIGDDNYLNIINNLQKREQHIETTHIGLVNIANRYSYFTDKPTRFGIEGNKFVAKIPLL